MQHPNPEFLARGRKSRRDAGPLSIARAALLLIASLGLASAVVAATEGTGGAQSAEAAEPGAGYVRLPGHIAAALADAVPAEGAPQSTSRMTLTLTLRRDDEAGFQRYMQDVYDPVSPRYREFSNQADLTARFGPSRQAYHGVLQFLRASHLHLVAGSKNRLTLTVRGTRGDVERAFRTEIRDYRMGSTTFYANVLDPALPTALAPRVLAVGGLSSLSAPQSVIKSWAYQSACHAGPQGQNYSDPKKKQCVDFVNAKYAVYRSVVCNLPAIGVTAFSKAGPLAASLAVGGGIWVYLACALTDLANSLNALSVAGGYSSNQIRDATQIHSTSRPAALQPVDGAGQTIGLVEFDGFNAADVGDYLAYIGVPATLIGNLSTKSVNGGISTPGSGETEVLLDIDTALTLAPGAKVAVYEAPFNGNATSYTAVFNAMINDGVTVISNSWASCEDQVSLAEAQSVDAVLQSAAASGISVFNGSGDSGSTCLDGSPATITVPADSPNATAVGGTSWPQDLGPGRTYGAETWWDGSSSVPPTGQGGFGVSKYFTRPAYQSPLSVGPMRSIPDVAVRADPANGVVICQADSGGCPSGTLNGGTSLAAPEWAAIAAQLNEKAGKNLGALNPQIYALAGTNAFHSAASMGSDFQHVGLGSPNINVLGRMLSGQTSVGVPDAGASRVLPLFQPSTATLMPDGSFPVPADGTSTGGVLVILYDAKGNTVSGKTVTLTAAGGSAVITPATAVSTVENGAAVFSITDLNPETLTLTATDTSDGVAMAPVTVTFGVPSAASGGISANPPTVAADGQSAATVTVTLKDSLNRPTPGKTVTVTSGGSHAVLSGPASGVTDANGQIQFLATDQVNETVTFSAVDVSDANLAIPGSATVTYSGSVSTACGVGVTPTPGTGYSITAYVTGLPAAPTIFYGDVNIGCPGAENPVFLPSGEVLIGDFLSGGLYQTGLSGGAVTTSSTIATLPPALANFTVGKDGSLYASQGTEGAQIVQLNPATGAVLRTVASGLTCPTGLAVDPLSGDLFFTDDCTGAGTDNASIFRLIDPAGTDTTRPTSVVVYATLPATPNGTLAFAPNGTLYAVSGYYGNVNAPVQQVSATNSPTVTVAALPGISSDFAVAIGATNADGSASSLIVEPAGNLSEVPIATPAAAVVLATGSPGVGVTGPDGCLYSAHYDTIYRLANSSGECNFAPTSTAPFLTLSPTAVAPNPAQGSAQTFSASLHNTTPAPNVPIYFSVAGANPQVRVVHADANGVAAFTYSGVLAGGDVVTATSTSGTTYLQSNSTPVKWASGKDSAFITLNLSAQGGLVNQPVTLVASLIDVAVGPFAPIVGQSVTLALGSVSCVAITSTSGIASCAVTPSQAGSQALSATFAGTSQFTSAKDSANFNVFAAPTPAPTVTISVNPTTIAAGSSATLSWSSTSATACTASGTWSGSEATSGTLAVTPTTSGSYSYTLTCTGAGGSAAATAVLSATLVAVTVTAKSGGGAFGWYLLLFLAVLVIVRYRTSPLRPRELIRDGAGIALLVTFGISDAARAEPAMSAADASPALDPFYVGIRVGGMPVRQDAGRIEQGLADRGFGDVTASSDTSGTAGSLFVGYEFTPHTAVELGYTFRESTAARLNGAIGSTANLTPLLRNTTELIRGYGNIVALSYAGRFELVPRFSLEPRLGGFFWATKVSAVSLDDRIDTTHEGGGVTAGLTAAYRVWRGLELGVSVDHYRGSPSNIATLYAGTLEWRFGR